MKINLAILLVGCLAIGATQASLTENELKDTLFEVVKQFDAKQLGHLNILIGKFSDYERKGRGLPEAMSDYLLANTKAFDKNRKGFDKIFNETIGDSCSSLIKAVSKYESDYEHLKENPDYFPTYNVAWWFKGLGYCRQIEKDLGTYRNKTYNVN